MKIRYNVRSAGAVEYRNRIGQQRQQEITTNASGVVSQLGAEMFVIRVCTGRCRIGAN